MRFSILILPFIISVVDGCSSGVELLPVSKEPLLNDLNSKVWLVDQLIKTDTNYAPPITIDKDILVFYHTGKCLYQPMKSLGDMAGKKGEYALHSDDMNLSMYFGEEKWSFTLNVISEDTLVLVPKEPTEMGFTMVLTPFPEL